MPANHLLKLHINIQTFTLWSHCHCSQVNFKCRPTETESIWVFQKGLEIQLKWDSETLLKQSCWYVIYHVTICRICTFMQENIRMNDQEFSTEFWHFTFYINIITIQVKWDISKPQCNKFLTSLRLKSDLEELRSELWC